MQLHYNYYSIYNGRPCDHSTSTLTPTLSHRIRYGTGRGLTINTAFYKYTYINCLGMYTVPQTSPRYPNTRNTNPLCLVFACNIYLFPCALLVRHCSIQSFSIRAFCTDGPWLTGMVAPFCVLCLNAFPFYTSYTIVYTHKAALKGINHMILLINCFKMFK